VHAVEEASASSIELYWIPLGAGQQSVRVNGVLFEALRATVERRERCELYHSVLRLRVPSGAYWVEMAPVADGRGERRGVVAEGPVGLRLLGRARLFRYEIRRWRDGVVPDLAYAVESPVLVTTDADRAAAAFDAVPQVPTLVWGRDESHVGEMWTCNSVISWALAAARTPVEGLPFHATAELPVGAPAWRLPTAATSG